MYESKNEEIIRNDTLNSFRYSGINSNVPIKIINFFKFNILIETNQLGKFQLSKERIKRLKLIYSLHKTGYTNREICDFLNRKKLKTFRTNKDYTPKLIHMTIKKYKNRLLRNKSVLISIREGLYVTPMNKYTDK